MDPHPGSEHKIVVMLPWTLVYFRCLSRYLAPYVGSNVAGQEGHFIFSREWDEEVGDFDGRGSGGDSEKGLFGLLVGVVGGVVDDRDDGAEVYLELWMRLGGEVGDMDDGGGGGGSSCNGEDNDFEGITVNPVGDIGEIGEPDDDEGIIQLGVVTVGDIGEGSNSDGAVVGEESELASPSVWEEFVEQP